ncbi:hypothetical protein MNBD_CHLOROFLEXI01-1975 [hydrothermal vent metagenome]|uniref:PDZ domain-containing protein n=1 Tax=hydrothermal vent metagenome TaxID=652676 RepID=A0A3B0WF87_9ZZZZ
MSKQEIYIIFIFVAIISVTSCGRDNNDTTAQTTEIPITDKDDDGWPDAWDLFGNDTNDYYVGVDTTVGHNDNLSATIQAVSDESSGFASISRQYIAINQFLGQRVRLSGYIRTENVTELAGLWFRIDGQGRGNTLAFDNMSYRPIIGSNEWQQYDIILDVPETGVTAIYYGFLLTGQGQAWVDDIQFEVVDEQMPTTDIYRFTSALANSDFESPVADADNVVSWQIRGSQPSDYNIDLDANTAYAGSSSGTIASATAEANAFGILLQNIDSEPYQGKRIRLSAYLKTENVSGEATLFMHMQGQRQPISDDMSDRPLTGTNEWQAYEIILDTDKNTRNIFVGVKLLGQGQLWVDDIKLEVIDESSASTGQSPEDALPMAVFEQLVKIIDEQYVYENYNGADWEAITANYQVQVEAGLEGEAFWEAMDNMVGALNDEHSYFLSPDAVVEQDLLFSEQESYVGVGMFVRAVPEHDYSVVLFTFPNGPAHQTGIAAHDRLLAVDNEPICCDEAGHHFVDAIRGLEGTEVRLTIQTPGEAARDISVPRAPISGSAPIIVERLPENIGYLAVPTLQDPEIGEGVTTAWQTLNDDGALSGLVLDLRVNLGGDRRELYTILSLFTNGRLGLFQEPDRQTQLFIEGQDILGSQTIPLVILVSEFTESNAEVLAGVLQEAERALVIGQTTRGNVEFIQAFDFADGSRAFIAIGKFIPSSGSNWEETGIEPDVMIDQGWHEFYQLEDDLALQAAIKWLRER